MAGSDEAFFDLNIERFLEHWTTAEALREVIANASDEQLLSGSAPIEITRVEPGTWKIRDFGRGLRIEHFTQNENREKRRRATELPLLGRFGVGLKDALATLDRRGVEVRIRSRHGDYALVRRAKAGFDDLLTLHVSVRAPSDGVFVGTEFELRCVDDRDVETAKNYFRRFSGEETLEVCDRGAILDRRPKQPARIYVRGLRIAEEPHFAFSYDVTHLSAAMARALNRERSHVGRAAYSDPVKAILLRSSSERVAKALAEQIAFMDAGDACDEVRQWLDVQEHACRVLNATGRVVFVSSVERTTKASAVDEALRAGFEVVTIPSRLRERLEQQDVHDATGAPVRHLGEFMRERHAAFSYKWVPASTLMPSERRVWDTMPGIVALVGGLPEAVYQVKVSETLCPSLEGDDTLGAWVPESGTVVVRRDQLRDVRSFAGTLLHEFAHAESGADDVTRDFEHALSDLLGRLAEAALVSGRPLVASGS